MASESPFESPALVGSTDAIFRISTSDSRTGQGQSALLRVQNLGLNPTLNKQLKASVSAVSPKVIAVRKSFDVVEGTVERFSRHDADKKILEDWKFIETANFITHIIPYLISSTNFEKKCAELEAYCETLECGQVQARKFSKTLTSITSLVCEFNDKWHRRTEDAVDELKDSIKRLETEIRELTKSICDVFQTRFLQKDNVSELRVAKYNKKDHEKMKKAEQQEIRQRNEANRLVDKHTNQINASSDVLQVVWNLIYDDLYLIKSHLRITATGKADQLFRQRLAKLPEQYNALKDALEKYSLALSMEPVKAEKSSGVFGIFRHVFQK
ncbi:hypothetical protein SCHPADRAFT_890012 [Schizopora paradoxa]|uniref:Uncharacterized protein n=1 Tax=Schizopora paradoxa TaxID=27342 RepID=A0A0H2RND8_9AGAM|nr:hypothetical protein SCHPADRAFT_890012 [Schizopora paradoxa]